MSIFIMVPKSFQGSVILYLDKEEVGTCKEANSIREFSKTFVLVLGMSLL